MAKMFTITDWVPSEKTDEDVPEVVFHTWDDEARGGHVFRVRNTPHPIWAISQIMVEAGYEEMSPQEFEDLRRG